MKVIREFPVEFPDRQPGTRKKNYVIKMPNQKIKENEAEDTQRYNKRVAVDIMNVPHPRVSLSGKKNIDALVGWMEEHMEAYKETRDGFLVDFIDDDWKKGYKVAPYDNYEVGDIEEIVMINGEKYSIFEYTFSKKEYEMYNRIDDDVNGFDHKENAREDYIKKNRKRAVEDLANAFENFDRNNYKNKKNKK